jgi:hypothetical protein
MAVGVYHWPTTVRVYGDVVVCDATKPVIGATLSASGDIAATVTESGNVATDYVDVAWHSSAVPYADITVSATVPSGKGISAPASVASRVWACSAINMLAAAVVDSGYTCVGLADVCSLPVARITGSYTDDRGSCTLTWDGVQYYTGSYSYGSNPANSGLPYVVFIRIWPSGTTSPTLTDYGAQRVVDVGSDTGDTLRTWWGQATIHAADCDALPSISLAGHFEAVRDPVLWPGVPDPDPGNTINYTVNI